MADQPKKWIRPAVRSGQRSVTAPDGIGFGVTHSMVTMMFENSLQLVNPMISLPYWDFTIEGAVVDNDEELAGDYTRLSEASPLWTPDWFGGVDKHDYQVGFFFFVDFALLGLGDRSTKFVCTRRAPFGVPAQVA